MDELNTYQIELGGRLDEDDLTQASPFQMTLLHQSEEATSFTVRTDQSGLIGLLRHLHGRGLTLLAVDCQRSAGQAQDTVPAG